MEPVLAARMARIYISRMTRLQKIEQDIAALTADEFVQLARWMAEREAALFDARLEQDALAGRLDDMAREALRDHAAHTTTVLAR
jgi:hypothetical protein